MECDWGAPYNYQKVVPTFLLRALRQQPLPVYGDGHQRSEYLYIDDAVRSLMLAADCESSTGRMIPIGTGEPVSVQDLAQLILRLTDSDSEIQFLPMRSGESKVNIQIDTSVAEEQLCGFRAQWTWKRD